MTSHLRRVLITALLSFSAAALTACGVNEEPSPAALPEQTTDLAAEGAADRAAPITVEEASRPITAAEIEEVRRSKDFIATMEILSEDGESIKLEDGITSVHEASLNGVDISFTPLDASGRPSLRNLEVIYQRSDTAPPHFYFVSDTSSAPSAVPSAKPADAPISTLCLGGSWSSWSTSGGTCGYRWLCSRKKWNHDAWFEFQSRWKRCWNGTLVTQSRTHFAHCGC